jgi:cytochrome c
MSDLTVNKIAFCVLGTGLLVIGVNEASHAFFHTAHHETCAYCVEVPETQTGGPAVVEEGPRDYNALLTSASIEAGQAVAVKCLQCHNFEPGGAALQGPPLYDIMGHDIAANGGFKYSDAMAGQEGVWSYEKLDHFLENPKKEVPGTAMNFVGLRKQQDRSDLMAYLRTLTAGEPLALPEPLPAVAEVPAEGAVVDPAAVPADGAAPAATPAVDPAAPVPATPPAETAPAN